MAGKLVESLAKPDLPSAIRYCEMLAPKIHREYTASLQERLANGSGDPLFDENASLTGQLNAALRNGNIARAVGLARDLQAVQKALSDKGKKIPMLSRNIYDINDALGRAALLKGDTLTASDYLLKAAETPGNDPALTSFGPDLWLAKALLAQGQTDVVVTFLDRCRFLA